jgi:hypothetical protein
VLQHELLCQLVLVKASVTYTFLNRPVILDRLVKPCPLRALAVAVLLQALSWIVSTSNVEAATLEL